MNQFRYQFNQPIPNGFTLIASGYYEFVIKYKRTGMGCMNAFLIVCLVLWLPFCLLILPFLLNLRAWLFIVIPLFMWGFAIGFIYLIIYSLFCQKTFYFDDNNLTIETKILVLRWEQKVQKNFIKSVIQIQDGGEDEDSFPSWGLNVEANKQVSVIYRQPYEKSHWLGQIIAEWAKVDFIKS
ncbi:hypothetical protein VB715_01115 [Crocosphaera sp. UHCC 0190]|uniref:hypothetical protein n=1 Tax=Crocosphaera sp. UHCC 0190 TaxID=3110246 RepID=UPI002B20291F|nr:hypothetical protein [Crocosphaera sp. UHCC 0190]MEA5508355.1 hypothetical protein [Crocosphaera sp. UHCC 0190]